MKNRLKTERLALKLTQEDMANVIGVTRQTISSIEKNRCVPSAMISLKLSKIFHKSVNDIFELEDTD